MNIRNDTIVDTQLLIMIDSEDPDLIEFEIGAQCYMWNVDCLTSNLQIDPINHDIKLIFNSFKSLESNKHSFTILSIVIPVSIFLIAIPLIIRYLKIK